MQLGGVVPVYTALGTTQSFISADSIEEFQVQIMGSKAELGRTVGAHVLMTTRAGTNQFHGSVAGYLRNEALDANDWFAARGGQPRTRFRMQDISGTVGGPVIPIARFSSFRRRASDWITRQYRASLCRQRSRAFPRRQARRG